MPYRAVQALDAQVPQVMLTRKTVGRLVDGKPQLAKFQQEIALLGDGHGVLQRLGHLGEQLVHLLGRPEVKLLGHIAHAFLVGEQRLRLQADQAVMGFPVFALDVMHVVGRDQREIEFLRPGNEGAVDGVLLRDSVVLQLHIEIAGRKDLPIVVKRGLGLIELAFLDLERDFALEAGGKPDQTLRMFRENLLVDARLVVEAVEVRRGDKLNEIFVADFVLRQQDQMIRGVAGVRGFLFEAAARRDIRLAPDDRLQPLLLRGLVELDGTVHVAMIGHGHRRHLACMRFVDNIGNTAGPVEQAVLGVQVKMDKIRVLHQNSRAPLLSL